MEIKRFGDLQVGDVVVGSNGGDATVTRAHELHIPAAMYELEFEDGTTIQASGNHLWYVEPDEDLWAHPGRLRQARKLLTVNSAWETEALTVANSETPFEIGLEDLLEFFDFIEDYEQRYHLIQRVCVSLGHIVEETITRQDYFSDEHEQTFERVYDARQVFQQMLALTGRRRYRRWPVRAGRVVTTETLMHRYPHVDVPTLTSH